VDADEEAGAESALSSAGARTALRERSRERS